MKQVRQELRKLLARFTWLDWLLVAAFLVVSVYLLIFSFARLPRRNVPVEYLAASEGTKEKTIWVDVAGEVVAPGVYQLHETARVKDALVAAGGLTEGADRDYLARVVNQADKLTDGEKIFIPPVNKSGQPETGSLAGSVKGRGVTLVDINRATDIELDSLPGIGKVRAGEIIKNRPYKSVDELLEKKVLPSNVFEQIKDKVSVY